MYKMIAIIGGAGAGKDTVLNKVIYEAGPAPASVLASTISCTTRPPRDYEKDGVDYHFLDNETFAGYVLENKFVEVAEFNGWFYGTLKDDLKKDKINIAVLNPAGVENVLRHNDINLKVFYLDVPGRIRIIRQLQREKDPDIPEVLRRYLADDEDFYNLPFNHIILKNENQQDFDVAWQSILNFARNWAKEDN